MSAVNREDIDDVKKLFWKMCGLSVTIGTMLFVYFVNVNAQQWQNINEKLDKEMFIRYSEQHDELHKEMTIENKHEHNKISEKVDSVVSEIGGLKTGVNVLNVQMENMNKSLEEMKELIKNK